MITSLLEKLQQSWGLWGIIITFFVVSRFNYINRDILTLDNMIINYYFLSIAWIIIFSLITVIRVYADITRR